MCWRRKDGCWCSRTLDSIRFMTGNQFYDFSNGWDEQTKVCRIAHNSDKRVLGTDKVFFCDIPMTVLQLL